MSTLKAGRDSGPTTNGSPDRGEDPSPRTLVMPTPVPTYPTGLTQAWNAVHKEIPESNGAEKALNLIGVPIIYNLPEYLLGLKTELVI